MSADPLDLITTGGSGLAGAGVVAALVRYLIGGAIADLKEKLAEFKADVREQMTGLKEALEHAEDRHERHVASLVTVENKLNALHQRVDTFEAQLREVWRRLEERR